MTVAIFIPENVKFKYIFVTTFNIIRYLTTGCRKMYKLTLGTKQT